MFDNRLNRFLNLTAVKHEKILKSDRFDPFVVNLTGFVKKKIIFMAFEGTA